MIDVIIGIISVSFLFFMVRIFMKFNSATYKNNFTKNDNFIVENVKVIKIVIAVCTCIIGGRKNHFAELMQKKNAAISKRITTLPKIHIQFCRTFLLSSFSTSEISFAVAVTIRMPLSLISSSRASSCRRFVSFPTGVSKRNWSTDIL